MKHKTAMRYTWKPTLMSSAEALFEAHSADASCAGSTAAPASCHKSQSYCTTGIAASERKG